MDFEADRTMDYSKDAEYTKTLHELRGVVLNENTDMTFFMNAVLDIVARAVRAEAGTLWLYSRSGDGRIHPKAQYGGSNLGGFSLVPGEGVAGTVIRSGEGTMIENCQKDARWSGKVDAGTGFVTRSMICVPLMNGDTGFGCIQLINKTDGCPYDDKDMKFMNALAGETAALFTRHEGDAFREYFSSGEAEDGNLFRVFTESNNEEELIGKVRRTPEYLRLEGVMAWQLENSCRSVWKLTH